jgi:hypothetical protein
MRRFELERTIQRLRNLKQGAAIERAWAEIYQIIGGLNIEVSNYRNMLERDGIQID